MNTSSRFISSVDRIQRQMVPENVLNRVRQSLLDYVAVTTAGAKFQSKKTKDCIALASPGQGGFTVIGTKETLALRGVIFLSGLSAHTLDFDDGTNSETIHLGSPIFSLLPPLAQRYDVKIENMLKAAIIGYETSYTMAVSIQPGHKAFGYHATGTCGILGVATAASYILDFSKEEGCNAFATACVSATGVLKILGDGSELKSYDVAKATLLALTSIQLAEASLKGHPDPLRGNRGYFRMITGKEDIELKSTILNSTYAIQKTYTKPYASCRYTHPSIGAVTELRNEYGLTAGDVESIRTKTYSLAVSGYGHADILGSYSAKMSMSYSTAAGFLYGRAGLQELSEAGVQDRVVLDLTKGVTVVPDEEVSAAFPTVQATIMELKTTDNRTPEKRVNFPKEEPENPLSDKGFEERHHELMDYAGIDRGAGSRIFDTAYREDVSAKEILELFMTERQEPADE